MLFTYSPDNPEGAAHQLQLFGGILADGSANLHIPGMTLRQQRRFHRGEVIRGAVCGCGFDAAGAARPVDRQSIAFFLKCLQVNFHLCDTTGDFFSERLPKFIRRSLSRIAWSVRVHARSAFCGARFSASLFGRRRFSALISSGSELLAVILPGSFSVARDKEALQHSRGMASLLGCRSRYRAAASCAR